MAYKIVFNASFYSNLNRALNYISNDLENPSAANKIMSKLTDVVSLLQENPMLYPLYHNKKLAKQGFRYTVISKYLLFYKVHEEDQTVELSRFIFGNRNIPDMF